MAVRYFKTKDGKILVSKRDGSSKRLEKRQGWKSKVCEKNSQEEKGEINGLREKIC